MTMDLSGNTVLVTGGATGIGLAIAARFLKAGSRVIICGRRLDALEAAKKSHPDLTIQAANISTPKGREELTGWVTREHPRLNVLVNNAGIQRRIRLADSEPWDVTHEEIASNLEAPIHLSRLLVPHLAARPASAIINVTSGLAFSTLAAVPIYCATKAALHSFTMSLRHQLRDTSIRVVEIIPPAVNTDLGGPGLHTFGVDVNEFADAVMAKVAAGAVEAAYGFGEQSSRASREELDASFQRMNTERR